MSSDHCLPVAPRCHRITASNARQHALRRGLAVIVAAGAILLAPLATAQTPDKRFDGVTLRIASWGGANRDTLHQQVASEIEKRGGKVEFIVGTPQENFAKLIAARGREPPFDLIEFVGAMAVDMDRGEFLQPLRFENVPNAKLIGQQHVYPRMVSPWITEEVIIYNTARYAEAGLPPPKSVADLRNAKLNGRVSVPDISSGGGIEAVTAFAVAGGGDEARIEPGLKLIQEIPNVRFWKAGPELITLFKAGDIWAAVAHAGYAVRASQAGVPVAIVPGQLGDKRGVMKEGYIGVVKGARNRDAAEFFINAYLAAEPQYQFAAKIGVIPNNLDARKRLQALPEFQKLTLLDETSIDQLLRVNGAKVDMSRWSESWNRMVAK